MLFKEIAPIIILLTLVVSVLLAVKIKRSNIFTIDGAFSILGMILGLLISFLNLIYSNNYLISLGPLLTIASLVYLKFRNKLLAEDIDLNLNLSSRALKIIQIIYWICILVALISYYQADPYSRPVIFFVSISIAVGTLGLEILSYTYEKNIRLYTLFFKILMLSLILRLSAYFISPYPVGVDPWGHANLITDISIYGTSYLTKHSYYSNYPLMHIYASTPILLGNLTTKSAMSVVGMVLAFSTIFVYVAVKKITNSTQLALFSMLLLSFSDFHVQWSVQLIAMTFGISIYTMIFYLLIEQNEKINNLFGILLAVAIFVITWTHTISTFIYLVSLISLYVGSHIYERIYTTKNNSAKLRTNIFLCILSVLILIYHWTDPRYPFAETIINGLGNSVSSEAKFLGRSTASNSGDSFSSILDILGFLIFIFFGVVGSLHSLSKENQTRTKVSLIFMLVVLFGIFFTFPVMGIRNIVPFRWPAFIYTTFVLFFGTGVFKITGIINGRLCKTTFISILLITFSFFMITNSMANTDSPIYGKSLSQKLFSTESEVEMCIYLNNSYDNLIITDGTTGHNIFETYLSRDRVASRYAVTPEGNLDWERMGKRMLTWSKMRHELIIKQEIDNNCHAIYDSGVAKAYLGAKRV
ncbi:hypothetical protein [Methanosarcina sp.]|uniref:hypothetical protein n=1 Tax=Methanosarcina sp. TaxID=2213 RepID=UPI003C746930